MDAGFDAVLGEHAGHSKMFAYGPQKAHLCAAVKRTEARLDENRTIITTNIIGNNILEKNYDSENEIQLDTESKAVPR